MLMPARGTLKKMLLVQCVRCVGEENQSYGGLALHEGRGLLVVETQLAEEVVLDQVVVRVRLRHAVHQLRAAQEENARVRAQREFVVRDLAVHHVVREEHAVVAVVHEDVVRDANLLRVVHEDAAAAVQRPVAA